MQQVLFAGNIGQYGTLTPAFLAAMAKNGVEPLVLGRHCDYPSNWTTSYYNLSEARLGTPVEIGKINPQVIHAVFGREMPPCQVMLHIDLLAKRFEGAKLLVGLDGVRTDHFIFESTLRAADAVAVPHRSLLDSLTAAGKKNSVDRIIALESSGMLFEVRPGIDTKKFNPETDDALILRSSFGNGLLNYRFNGNPPYDVNGSYNDRNPSVKKALCRVVSDEHGLYHHRDMYTMLYGPNISDPESLAQLAAQVYFSERTPLLGTNTLFVGTDRIAPSFVRKLREKVIAERGIPHVAYTSLAENAEYRRLLGGTFIGIFPPEAGEFGFASVPYVQRIMEAMRYGAIVAAAPAFERQGVVIRYPSKSCDGNGFPATSDDPKSFNEATDLAYRHAFEYINGNHRFSEVVISAMEIPCSVEETARVYLDIYRKISR